MVLATGAMFMVPRGIFFHVSFGDKYYGSRRDLSIGNTYFIENICDREAKLFFTQARKVEMTQEELISRGASAAERRRRKSARSSSAGASPTKPQVPTPNGRATTR